MKRKAILLIKMLSKFTFYGLVILCILSGVLMANDTEAQPEARASANEIKVDLQLHEVRLETAFQLIEQQTGLRFFYDRNRIDLDALVSSEKKMQSLAELLIDISRQTQLKFKRVNQDINVGKMDRRTEEKERFVVVAITVSGQVKDPDGEALPGVNVLVKGSSTGTVTDIDGMYTLSVPNENDVLVFSSIGYATQEVPVNGRSVIDISMQEDIQSLSEIVVVGYGEQKKVNLTGSVATVEGERLTRRPVTNTTSMLQGQVPGLRIVQNSGEPGNEGLNVRIRGQGTFSGAGSNPLVLIDGVEGNLADLDPNNIENVSVLKDAASASIYGSRAANGVILVTTKKGKEGRFNVEYNGNYAVHTPTKLFDLITNSAEYMEFWNEAKLNNGISDGLYPQEEIDLYRNATDRTLYPNADWLDIVFNPAPTQTHHLSFNGGKEGTTYNLALGIVDQQGVMKGFDYKRYNARLNIASEVNDNVKFGANLALKKGDRNGPRQGSTDLFLATMSQAPTYLPQLPDGRYTYKAYDFESNNKNPIAIVENDVLRKTVDYTINAQGWADINFTESLNWYTKAAIVGSFDKWKDWRPSVQLYNYRTGEFATDLDVGGRGLITQDEQNIYTNIFSYLQYQKQLGAHTLNAQIGYSQEFNEFQYLYGFRRDFTGNLLRELDAGSPAVQNANGTTTEWAIRSFFGRLGYNFDERYLLEFNMRYDGSSRLYQDTRWGAFPSVSAGWRVSEESFVQNAGLNWLDDLKIRASYGELGNQNIGLTRNNFDYPYPYQSLLSLTGNYPFDNANLSSGAAQVALANQNIQWETTQITDIGLDLTVFKGLSLTFDWYKKRTTDILRSSQVTGVVGLTPPTVNNGTMENTGIELNLNYRNSVQDGTFSGLTYDVNFFIDRFKNELTQFGEREISGNVIKEEGRPWDTFYMLEWIGIFQNEAEVDAAPPQYNDNTEPGDLIFKDQNGDGVVNDNDRIPIDGQYPNFEYAMNFNTSWKGFDLSFFFQGVEGRQIYVNNWGTIPFVQGSPPTTEWRDRWTEENPSTTMPKIYWGFNAPAKVSRTSSYFLQDASYLRLKNLTIGYSLPSTITERISLQKVRVYVSGDNLLTVTNYPGLDPERGGSGSFVNYPQNKIYSVGLNVQF
ncbi:SusC/RagA family TonB-linked outer membrane protein [Catalinimonas niigatensis]|uniref:SusC/RagA family TonB-linked outer membrane protein n=1 Tax=Catalinimonas niigatensis TaxID=1397264 RepID=UPI0026669D25|nr:TonB-dependent receptor [Catalinimonas niigatensis]WPP49762.1 TonB-dependent receptor [Catalinimonas niigatensis]